MKRNGISNNPGSHARSAPLKKLHATLLRVDGHADQKKKDVKLNRHYFGPSCPSSLLLVVLAHDCGSQGAHSTHLTSGVTVENVRASVVSGRQRAFFENAGG